MRALPSRPRFSRPGPQRVGALAVDLDLLRQREADRIVQRTELADLRGITGLLRAELVAREADHHQAALAVVLPQLFQPGVLRGEATAAGDVHQQQRVALVPGQRLRLAVEVTEAEIVGGGHGRAVGGECMVPAPGPGNMPFDTSAGAAGRVTLGPLFALPEFLP
jgi:hypothetical protein